EDLDLTVFRRRPAAGGKQLAVLAEVERHHAVRKAGELLLQEARLRIPEDDFLEAPAGDVPAVGAEDERLHDVQVRSGNRLALIVLEVGIDERTDESAAAGVVDVDLIAAAGGHRRLIRTHRQRNHWLHQFRQPSQFGRTFRDYRIGRRFGALLNPQFD